MSIKTLTGCLVTALALTYFGNYPFLAVAEGGPGDERLDRQILMFERVLDDMLVESPNFLVQSRHNALGTYIDGQGAVFTFKAGLNYGDHGDSWNWRGKEVFEFFFGDDDRDRRSRDEWDEYVVKKQEKLYARGKEEIIETLQDFGGLLSGLDGRDWVEIKVRLRGSEYFDEHDLRRLNVRVRVEDIRAYSNGAIDDEGFQRRVEMKES